MPMRCMISCARTLPTPGIDCRRSMTLSLAMTSLARDSWMTSVRLAREFLRRFLTSARSCRAAAAFSSAALRCSGVNIGSATCLTSSVVRNGVSAELDLAFLLDVLDHGVALLGGAVELLVGRVDRLELIGVQLLELGLVLHLFELDAGLLLGLDDPGRGRRQCLPVRLVRGRSVLADVGEQLRVA